MKGEARRGGGETAAPPQSIGRNSPILLARGADSASYMGRRGKFRGCQDGGSDRGKNAIHASRRNRRSFL